MRQDREVWRAHLFPFHVGLTRFCEAWLAGMTCAIILDTVYWHLTAAVACGIPLA